MPTQWVEVL